MSLETLSSSLLCRGSFARVRTHVSDGNSSVICAILRGRGQRYAREVPAIRMGRHSATWPTKFCEAAWTLIAETMGNSEVRSKTLRVLPSSSEEGVQRLIGERVAWLWNVASSLCGQRFLNRNPLPSYPTVCSHLPKKYSADGSALPSDIAQESLKTLYETWKSLLAPGKDSWLSAKRGRFQPANAQFSGRALMVKGGHRNAFGYGWNMPTKKATIYRTDLQSRRMNPGKEAGIRTPSSGARALGVYHRPPKQVPRRLPHRLSGAGHVLRPDGQMAGRRSG